MIDAPLDYLVRKLEKQRIIVTERIVKGDLDEGEYKKCCGMLYSLTYVRDLIIDTDKRIANEEEGEEDE